MRIATFNVKGINGRFLIRAIEQAGYGAIWQERGAGGVSRY